MVQSALNCRLKKLPLHSAIGFQYIVNPHVVVFDGPVHSSPAIRVHYVGILEIIKYFITFIFSIKDLPLRYPAGQSQRSGNYSRRQTSVKILTTTHHQHHQFYIYLPRRCRSRAQSDGPCRHHDLSGAKTRVDNMKGGREGTHLYCVIIAPHCG